MGSANMNHHKQPSLKYQTRKEKIIIKQIPRIQTINLGKKEPLSANFSNSLPSNTVNHQINIKKQVIKKNDKCPPHNSHINQLY